MEPILVHSTIKKEWFSTYFLKIWFFEEFNIVCKEIFIKRLWAIEHIVHTIGGTEQDRQKALETLNEFCEAFEEDH